MNRLTDKLNKQTDWPRDCARFYKVKMFVEHDTIPRKKQCLDQNLHFSRKADNFLRRCVHGYDLWQADVVDALNLCDSTEVTTIFSPLLMCWVSTHGRTSLKVKKGNKMTKVIPKIIRDNGRCRKNLHTDRKKKVYNSDVFLRNSWRSHHYNSTYFIMKASVIERFNRMLKNNMWK